MPGRLTKLQLPGKTGYAAGAARNGKKEEIEVDYLLMIIPIKIAIIVLVVWFLWP